jgi:hypothetical protein
MLVLMTTGVSPGQNVELGIRVGVTTTSFVGDADTDFAWKAGFSGGFPITVHINERLAFQPEILFSKKGAKTNAVIEGIPLDLNFSISYLELPVLLKVTPTGGSTVRPFVSAGPVIAMNIDARVRFSAEGSSTEQTNQDDSIGPYDYGLAAGAGIDFDWNFRTFTLEARYTAGMSNLVDKDDDPKRNAMFSVMLGIGL